MEGAMEQLKIAEVPENLPEKKLPQYLTTVGATLIVFVTGCAAGWSSPALAMLLEDGSITIEQATWVGSLLTLGALFGALPTGAIADKYGRKNVLYMLSLPLFFPWIVMTLSYNVWVLLICRFILGIGVGSVSAVAGVYISEIADSSIRGALGTFYQIMFVGGIFYVYAIGAVMSFKWLAAMCGLITVAFMVAFLRAPESPVFLLRVNRKTEARRALQMLRGAGQDVTGELNRLQTEIAAQQETVMSFSEGMKKKASIRAMIMCCGLMTVQQLSGINVVIFYADSIFKDAGSSLSPSVASLLVGASQIFACFGCGALIDRYGRKLLLIVSAVAMALCLGGLGLYFYYKDQGKDVSSLGMAPVIALVGYIIFFCLGFGPIPWSIAGELLPPSIKGVAVGLVTALNWVLAFIVTKTFQDLLHSIGAHGTFWMFSSICAAGAVFVYTYLIETKGKTLQQIQDMLSQ